MPDFTDLLSAEEQSLDFTETTENEELGSTEPIDEDATVSAEDGDSDPTSDAEATVDGDESAEAAEAAPKPLAEGRIPNELKELIKAHPDRAKLLKDLYFTNARYNKFGKVADLQKIKDYVDSYGSLDEAVKMKETLDQVGDLNGLVESHKQYEALDQKFTAGDPAYVEHLAKANPEAFSKLAPSFLQRFGNDHPEQYNYLMSQVVMSTLVNNGALNQLSLLKQAAATGNVEQIKQAVENIEASLGAIQQLSARAPQVRTADPRVAQLEQERQQLQQERQQAFVSDIKDRTTSWVSPEISKALTVFGKAVTPGLAKRLDGAVKEEIGSLLGQNAAFQSKLKATIQRGDRDGALRLYRQFVTPLVNSTARKVAAEFGLKSVPKKAGAPDQPQSQAQPGRGQQQRISAGFERVTKYPDVREVKRDFPEYYDLAAKNQFILKSGKKIQVVD